GQRGWVGFGAVGCQIGGGGIPGRGDGCGGGCHLEGRLGGAGLARGARGLRVRGVGRDLLPLVALRGLPGVARQPRGRGLPARRVAGDGCLPVHGTLVRLRRAARDRARAGDAARHLRLPPRRVPASRTLGGGRSRPGGEVAGLSDGRDLPRLGHGRQRREPHLRGGAAGARGGPRRRRGRGRVRAPNLRRPPGGGHHPGRQERTAAGLPRLRRHRAVGARRRRRGPVRGFGRDDRGRHRRRRARPGLLSARASRRTDAPRRPQDRASKGGL
ncbi:MAG: hypothetical protein AVDCRST_MAG12-1313, partial [uncultured Rubrobacteraceae bacterium]